MRFRFDTTLVAGALLALVATGSPAGAGSAPPSDSPTPAAAVTDPGAAGLQGAVLAGVPVAQSGPGVSASPSSAVTAPSGSPHSTGSGQVLGGWFGNWHPPQTVRTKLAEGEPVLTDVALFAWDFAGKARPVCALTFHSGCVPATKAKPYQSKQTAQSFAAMAGTRRWVSHIDLNSERAGELAAVLRNPRQRTALIDQLVDWTVAIDAAGLDLDWENFAYNDSRSSWPRTRPALTATIRELAVQLHAADRLLGVTVPAGPTPFLPNGRPNPGSGYSVYDWGAIADSVDRLNLMTYDYSWSSAGPIGPNRWARRVAESAIAQVGPRNAAKVIVGVPLYGKSWAVWSNGRQVTTGSCPASWRPDSVPDTFSLTPTQAWELADARGAAVRFGRKAKEYTFRYSERRPGTFRPKPNTPKRERSCRVVREVWFSDTRSMVARATMADEVGAGGVFAWNLANISARLPEAYQRAMADRP